MRGGAVGCIELRTYITRVNFSFCSLTTSSLCFLSGFPPVVNSDRDSLGTRGNASEI